MQNTYGIGVPVHLKDRTKPIYKVNKTEERKAIAKEEAIGMVENRIARDKTIRYLVEAGYSVQEARDLVAGLESTKAKMKIQKAQRRMFIGGLWIVTGVVITLISYHIITVNAGFVLSGAAILFGGIQLFKGVAVSLG